LASASRQERVETGFLALLAQSAKWHEIDRDHANDVAYETVDNSPSAGMRAISARGQRN
jgi:hypothetical protein